MDQLFTEAVVYVSPCGYDCADGTQPRPVATLKKAAELVGDAKRGGAGNVTVHVAAGRYFMSEPLSLTEADSDTAWVADGEVILTGAMPLTDLTWYDWADNPAIKVADVAKDLGIDQLFVDGKQQILARYPNYDASQPLQGATTRADIKARSVGWKDPAGGYIRALHGNKWGGNSYRILGKEDNEMGLSYQWIGDNNRGSSMHPDCVMVENIFEELDSPGEWYYDQTAGKLYVMPAAGVVLDENTRIEAAVTEELIRIQGVRDGFPATRITFDGFTLENTARTMFTETYIPLMRGDWCVVRSGALFMQDAEYVAFKNGCIRHIGGNAVFLSGHCKGISIDHNEIRHIGSSGVLIAGLPDSCREPSFWGFDPPLASEASAAYIHKETIEDTEAGPMAEHYPRECVISHNHIKNVGIWEKQSSHVAISVASGIRVLHNTINVGPRAGININDGTYGGHEIAYNDVFDVQLETDDHGMFNSWGRDRFWSLGGFDTMGLSGAQKEPYSRLDCVEPILIHDNRFHFGGRMDGGSTFGIDLDDGSSNYKIYHNLCLNMGIKLREGFHREVYQNILVGGHFSLHCTFEDSYDRIYGNIVIAGQPYQMSATDRNRFSVSGDVIDRNWFYDLGADVTLPDFWPELGYDRNSIIGTADPLFRDPASNDYTVQNPVIADQMDFAGFSMTRFGKPGCADTCPIFQKTESDSREELLQRENWLGAIISALNDAIMTATAAGSLNGVYVERVPADSQAAAYGLRAGDVIREINGVRIVKKSELTPLYHALPKEARVCLGIVRNSQTVELHFEKNGWMIHPTERNSHHENRTKHRTYRIGSPCPRPARLGHPYCPR